MVGNYITMVFLLLIFIFKGGNGKYLLAGGLNELTEVVDLFKNISPSSFGQLPTQRNHAVGAMLGDAPILCGGSHWDGSEKTFDTCISYQDSEWSQSHSMVQKRYMAAGVQINSTTFWILGVSV